MRLSMNSYIRRVGAVISCAVLSALFIVLMFFCAPEISAVPETSGEIGYTVSEMLPDGTVSNETFTSVIGKDVTAVRISDFKDLNKITKVNYIADRHATPARISDDIQIVDLTKPFEFAEKGTLIFIIMNLNPFAENFYELKESLTKYKLGDYWNFTLSLPKIFCASNIYLRSELVIRHGEIKDYNFIDYTTSYDQMTTELSAHTERTDIELNFYTRREAMDRPLSAAQIVTIHYQSTGGAYSGITDAPLIGTAGAVKTVTENSQNVLIAFAIISAVVFAVFVVLAVLERSYDFISAIIYVFGIFIMLLSRFFLSGVTSFPLMWTAFRLASSFLILCGALLSSGRNFGKFPAKYIVIALASAGALFAFIRPFVSFGAAAALAVVCTVLKSISVTALLLFIGIATFRKDEGGNILRTVCSTLIAVAVLASLFLPQVFPTQYNPMFWMCVATSAAAFISVFIVFMSIKKSNVYLTHNLHREVERQLKDIKAIISERDSLLQFVSHDMRKPLNSSVTLLETAIAREKDAEQIKALQIIKQNDSRVVNNLSEIAAYARFNYISEPSQVTDIAELCASLCRFHSFDCNANGIVLKNLVDKKYKVFVKAQGLENALSNIIMNAVEHANCSTVTLSAKAVKNKVVLCIADDGRGISADMDVFKPYVSENKPETGGIGLYICKNIIESMNGSLSYESGRGGTAFYISLLKA